MIIGITGPNVAGKDTIAEYLKTKGFTHHSCSDIVREECSARGMQTIRENLILIGNELRARHGHHVMAERVLIKIHTNKEENSTIASIRNPDEAKVLQKVKGFFLLGVTAPLEARYQRGIARGKDTDKVSYETFQKQDEQERRGKEGQQQVDRVMAMADYLINNDKTIPNLHHTVDHILKELTTRQETQELEHDQPEIPVPKTPQEEAKMRPTWDNYFLGICNEVSNRATCDRGKAGCVITKNKRILTTGYVGSPIGTVHCDEEGHMMKRMIHKDDSITQHCVRTTHAEQNAICQAARFGIGLDGGTLYCKMEPCFTCAKMIINAGIKRVVCEKKYHTAQDTRALFKEANIILEVIHDEVLQYRDQ
jgi:dCMP deaminase